MTVTATSVSIDMRVNQTTLDGVRMGDGGGEKGASSTNMKSTKSTKFYSRSGCMMDQ